MASVACAQVLMECLPDKRFSNPKVESIVIVTQTGLISGLSLAAAVRSDAGSSRWLSHFHHPGVLLHKICASVIRAGPPARTVYQDRKSVRGFPASHPVRYRPTCNSNASL